MAVERAASEAGWLHCTAGCERESSAKARERRRRRTAPAAARTCHTESSPTCGRAAQIPRATERHHGQRPGVAPPAGGERGVELAQVEDEDGRVDGHVEDAGREREPALLVAPERAQRAPHPDVEAALGGNGAGQFADHERGGQAPQEGQHQQNEDGPGKAGAAENVLNAVGTARHHEVGGGDERQKAHLAPDGLENQNHYMRI